MTSARAPAPPSVRVGMIADVFADGDRLFEGGAERHLLRLAEAMQAAAIGGVVYQPGGSGEQAVGGIEVRSRPVRGDLWRALGQQALRDGCTHLYFKYLEHVPAGFHRDQVAATQHGVHWDIPYEAHGRPWYRGGKAARGYLPAWRARELGRSLAGLRRASAVSAMDTSFLRVTQALAPGLRGRIYVTPPFSDLDSSPQQGSVLPHELQTTLAAIRQGRGSVILVPRNLSLVRGESWLPAIAARVNLACPALFVVAGRFLGALPAPTRSARLASAPFLHLAAGLGTCPSILHLGGVDHSAFRTLLEASDLVLIPTFAHEGASLAAAEAMAAGKAVVATNVGGLNDTVDDGWTGRVTRPDPDDLAAALASLCQDPAARARLGAEAFRKAAACFGLARWREAQGPFFAAAGWATRSFA